MQAEKHLHGNIIKIIYIHTQKTNPVIAFLNIKYSSAQT